VGIPLLDRLFADSTRYVTRSVADHVNDISKTDPHVALDTLERWRSPGHQRARDMGYVIGHAARTSQLSLTFQQGLEGGEILPICTPHG
jgi:3-methyladenine DNA glycosylase AlkC